MLSYKLKNRLKTLSLEERREVITLLMRSSLKDDSKDRGQCLYNIMDDILGGNLNLDSRESRCVWARAMIAHQMRIEGYTLKSIGTALAKDHSSIIHLLDKMQGLMQFPNMYWDIMPIWNEFQKRLSNDIQ